MAATGNVHALLVLLLSGTLIVSAAALCEKKEAVLDISGNQVKLGPNYVIEYNGSDGRKGVLDLVRNDQRPCEKYVGPTSRRDANPVHFTAASGKLEDTVMQVGDRYVFSFIAPWNRPCKFPGVWTTGHQNPNSEFRPIIAGRNPESNDIRLTLFEVIKAEEEGSYKLAMCSCNQPKHCSCSDVGTHNLNGQTVLGEGGDSFTLRFLKEDRLAMKTGMQ